METTVQMKVRITNSTCYILIFRGLRILKKNTWAVNAYSISICSKETNQPFQDTLESPAVKTNGWI